MTETVKIEYLVVREGKDGTKVEAWCDTLKRAREIVTGRNNGPYGSRIGARFYVVKQTTTITREVVPVYAPS